MNARNVANKYKALYPEEEVKQFTQQYNTIDAIYSRLNKEVKKADITELMKKIAELVGESIQIISDPDREDIFLDLSNLDFEKLRELFEKQPMNKVVYDLQKKQLIRNLIVADARKST